MAREPQNASGEGLSGYRFRLPLGGSLGRYRILRPLGVDELAEYYLAEESGSRARVALSVFHGERAGTPEVLELLRNAVALTQKLNHPNIRSYLDVGSDQGLTFLVMVYVEGPGGEPLTLEHLLQRQGGRLRDELEVRRIALNICEALVKAHSEGVVHGDLHPAHILLGTIGAVQTAHRLLRRSRDELPVVVSGFGLHQLRPKLGLPPRADAYVSPEERAGELVPQTDYYALGVIIYRMLTGGRPGVPLVPPSRHGVSRMWDVVTERCLQPDPRDRYSSAEELKRDVAKAMPHQKLRLAIRLGVTLLALGVAFSVGRFVYGRVQAEIQRRIEERRLAEQRKAQADAWAAEAWDLFRLRKFAEADVLVRRTLDLIPDHPGARELQAELERASDMAVAAALRADALDRMEKLKAEVADPIQSNLLHSAKEHFDQAEELWTQQRYAEARDAYRLSSADCEKAFKLLDERRAATRQKSRAEQARWLARKHGAERDAEKQWTEAQDLMNQALLMFSQYQYRDAAKAFESAAKAYAEAQQVAMAIARQRAEEARAAQAVEEEKIIRARWPQIPPGYSVSFNDIEPVSGLPRMIEHRKTGYRLALIPAGPFPFGSPPGVGTDDERPQRTIVLSDYWIGVTEVTVEQFNFLLSEQGNQTEAGVPWVNFGPAVKISLLQSMFVPEAGFEQHPMVEVSWYGARAFAEWLGGDLPTECEWEKAAKGGRDTQWPWGNLWDKNQANTAERLALRNAFRSEAEWLNWWEPFQKIVLVKSPESYHITTQPVGSYSPNGYGLYDMAGNVFEWCVDYYVPYRSQRLQNNERDPPPVLEGSVETVTYWRAGEKITESAPCRVVRGGSWGYPADYARTSARFKALPTGRYSDVGFRVVIRTLDKKRYDAH